MHCDKMAGVNMLKLDQLRARAPRLSRRRFLATGGAALLCFATLNVGAVLAWYEPKRGSAERAEILDALRPAIEAEMRGPVEFVIQEFRASDGWAFVIADPQRPGGAAIAMNETGYAADAEFMDGLRVYALCRWSNDRWNLIDHVTGPTDVAFQPWPQLYGAPKDIFGF